MTVTFASLLIDPSKLQLKKGKAKLSRLRCSTARLGLCLDFSLSSLQAHWDPSKDSAGKQNKSATIKCNVSSTTVLHLSVCGYVCECVASCHCVR